MNVKGNSRYDCETTLQSAQSLQLGQVPKDWRKTNVTSIYKKGKKNDPGNYRLIYLISVPGKVMEQLLLDTISRHVKEIHSKPFYDSIIL